MTDPNPGHREIVLNYETGYDDGESASGYFLLRSKTGDLLRVGTFYTNGEGEFRFDGWTQEIEVPPSDLNTWDIKDLDKEAGRE